MRSLISSLIALWFLPFFCGAEPFAPPQHDVAISEDGTRIMRVREQFGEEFAIYRYDPASDSFVHQSDGRLPGDISLNHVFVTNDGTKVIVVDIHHNPSLSVIDGAGTLLKQWKVEDLMTPAQLEAIPTISFFMPWFEQAVWLSEHELAIVGPQNRSPHDDNEVRLLLDLDKMEFRKPNKPVETTSLARPEIREDRSLAVARRSVSHG